MVKLNKIKKLIVIALLLITSSSCSNGEIEKGEEDMSDKYEVLELYDAGSYAVFLNYDGLDMKGLEDMNKRYGSSSYDGGSYGDAEMGFACSITFAEYYNGIVGAVRNMDLQMSKYCAYEALINKGDNVKYPMWALSYTGMDDSSYEEVKTKGLSKERYDQIPFTATDAMSFGYDDNNNRSSLYMGILMRSSEVDEKGNYRWACSGTYPNAKIRCATQSLPILIGAQCVTIEQALAYVGAVDENYIRITPDIEPSLDVYTFSIETPTVSNHWFEVVAMEDSTGRHGVLEFMDNYAIWHEGADYSFNFFLQKDYLYNEDGTYKEQHGAGIGRMQATVPYLKSVKTQEEHLALMSGINYSNMTYYTEDEKNSVYYVGYDPKGNAVDWRSEFTGFDAFAAYYKFHSLNLNTSIADSKYKLWSNYLNTKTNKIEKVDSYDYWLENKDHLKCIWDMNYVLDDKNKDEVMNAIRWSGAFYSSLSVEEVRLTNSGWLTFFKVVADPMNFKVTRWFCENVTTADTYTWKEVYGEQ